MEGFHTAYKVLFNIEISLHGFRDDVNQFMRIVPDNSTNKSLLANGVLSRKQKNSSLALIQVVPEGPAKDSPVITLNDGDKFRFQVKCSDPVFLGRTHLADYKLQENVVILSNTVNHTSGADLLLTKAIAPYDATQEYRKGYLVQSSGSFYKAVQGSNSSDPHAVTDSAFWQAIPGGVYVSQADLDVRPSDVDLDTIMVVEIAHSPAVPSAYRLLDSSDKCREVTYKIKLYP